MALILGTTGANTLNGGAADDAILGFGGADTLNGGGGDDGISGGAGADTVNGGTGADGIDGGTGNDTLRGGAGIFSDTIFGAEGGDDLFGGEGDDDLFGGEGDDDLFGDAGADYFEGGLGDDDLFGGSGDDELFGNAGADTLDGGAGTDTMTGGTDSDGGPADVFDFDSTADMAVGAARDVITDFLTGALEEDVINLATIDADTTVAGNQAFTFVTGAFNAAGQVRVIQNPADFTQNIVQLNTDNDSAAEAEILDVLGNTAIASDFVL